VLLILRSRENSTIQKLYDTIFFIFVLESSFILLGFLSGAISYGPDIGGAIMAFGILIGLVVGIVLKMAIRKLNSQPKLTFGMIFSGIMFLFCLYYVFEDHFEMLW
ncbi:hypothetical protein JYT72_02270, partial [Crocinitomix catalasitica]|nr:hypothetical protein [Crocinitomix catalasitica]